MNVPALDRQLLKSFRHLHGVQFSHKKGPIDLNLGVSTAVPMQKKRSQQVTYKGAKFLSLRSTDSVSY